MCTGVLHTIFSVIRPCWRAMYYPTAKAPTKMQRITAVYGERKTSQLGHHPCHRVCHSLCKCLENNNWAASQTPAGIDSPGAIELKWFVFSIDTVVASRMIRFTTTFDWELPGHLNQNSLYLCLKYQWVDQRDFDALDETRDSAGESAAYSQFSSFVLPCGYKTSLRFVELVEV